MVKKCVVCDLAYPTQCEMCKGSQSLLDVMFVDMAPIHEAKCVEQPVDKRINIGSGEDVCLA
jgi:hypothetical protein